MPYTRKSGLIHKHIVEHIVKRALRVVTACFILVPCTRPSTGQPIQGDRGSLEICTAGLKLSVKQRTDPAHEREAPVPVVFMCENPRKST